VEAGPFKTGLSLSRLLNKRKALACISGAFLFMSIL
jgi:hypothetical protein